MVVTYVCFEDLYKIIFCVSSYLLDIIYLLNLMCDLFFFIRHRF